MTIPVKNDRLGHYRTPDVHGWIENLGGKVNPEKIRHRHSQARLRAGPPGGSFRGAPAESIPRDILLVHRPLSEAGAAPSAHPPATAGSGHAAAFARTPGPRLRS